MLDYPIPIGKSGVDETAYQRVVRRALVAETSGRVLIPPRARIRGKAWNRYRPPNLSKN